MIRVTRASADPIDEYLQELWELKGSDLLLTAGAPPLLRVDGEMRPARNATPLGPEQITSVLDGMLTQELADRFEANKELDFSFGWKSRARLRANAFLQRQSPALAVRLIPDLIPSFAELGLPAVVERLVNLPHGLILVTGPTGTGKSTTLASMIDYINSHRACHILTLEDPIEYMHKHKMAAVNQREIGQDTLSFERGLRASLREDPDVLLVGEMRDLESVRIALTMAETGHLVLATLHTNDAAQALDRVIDVFPAEHQQQVRIQLAASLQAIIFQQLLPKIAGGRVAAFEVLMGTSAARNLIREGKTQQLRNVMSTSRDEGMQTLETSLNVLVGQGLVDLEVARSRSVHPNDVKPPIGHGVLAAVASGGSENGSRGRRDR
jgi:twitching motility protein PilT